MDDIRLFETDGDYLVLEAQDGQKYRLLIDDSIRSSVKREQVQQLDTITITPREIQDEIRLGSTIEDLVRRSGAPFDYIEKFAAPVIDELSHIVDLALSIRLTIAGDRYSDSNQIEFGEIIGNRLATSGATAIHWRAKRAEFGTWHVTANYRIGETEGSAIWSFDPRRLALSPESETAVVLSSQEKLNDSPIPKLRTVIEPEPQKPTSLAETVALEDVIPIGRGQIVETPIAVEPPTFPTMVSVPAAFANRDQQAADSDEPLSATADLLDALRRKRTEREEQNLEPHPSTESLRVIDIDPPVSEPVAVIENPTTTKPAATKKGRASMPSWDEIVFGTKSED